MVEALLATLRQLPHDRWPSLLDQFCSSGDLQAHLNDVLLDGNKLDEMTRKSFYHPTGGYKLVLASDGYDGPELRLHIWPTGSNIGREHNSYSVHNHKWSFASRIVRGSFMEQIFIESTDAANESYDRYKFDSRVRGEEYESAFVGRRFLTRLFCGPLLAGAAYEQSSETLHSFQPSTESLSVTLFARTRYIASHTDVYVPAGRHIILDSQGPNRIDAAMMRQLLDLVRHAL